MALFGALAVWPVWVPFPRALITLGVPAVLIVAAFVLYAPLSLRRAASAGWWLMPLAGLVACLSPAPREPIAFEAGIGALLATLLALDCFRTSFVVGRFPSGIAALDAGGPKVRTPSADYLLHELPAGITLGEAVCLPRFMVEPDGGGGAYRSARPLARSSLLRGSAITMSRWFALRGVMSLAFAGYSAWVALR